MKTKSLYIVAFTFLFVMVSYPLYAGEGLPGTDPPYTPKTIVIEGKIKEIRGAEGETGERIPGTGSPYTPPTIVIEGRVIEIKAAEGETGERIPGTDPPYTPKTIAIGKVTDVKTFAGSITGEIVCLVEWETDQVYQGSANVCVNPRHDQRALVTEGGAIYILVAAEEASDSVLKALSSDSAERQDVVVKGKIIEGGPVNVVEVKSLKVK
jgi:hypothetical protein